MDTARWDEVYDKMTRYNETVLMPLEEATKKDHELKKRLAAAYREYEQMADELKGATYDETGSDD